MDAPEATAFMRRVYDAQVRNSLAAGKTYFTGLPENELRPVEGSDRMHKDAGDDCRWLLLFARQELGRLQKEDPSKRPTTIGIASAYRSAAKDGIAWRSAFETQYDRHEGERKKFSSGPHGDEAFRLLLGKMPGAKAAAGFSNHTYGRAVDFWTREVIDGRPEELTAKTSQHALWRKSWFFKWLVADGNAAKYRFVNLSTEEWHYDHRMDLKLPRGKEIPERAQAVSGELLATNNDFPSDET